MKNHILLIAAVALLTASGAQAATPYLAEFKAGKTKTYVASQQQTMTRIDITFKYPASWQIANEGSSVRTADESMGCILLRTEDPTFEAARLRGFFTDPAKAMQTMAPGAELISSAEPVVGGQPAFEYIYRMQIPDDKVTMQTLSEFVLLDGAMVNLQCIAAGFSKAEVTAQFEENLPLFRLIAGSLTIQPK